MRKKLNKKKYILSTIAVLVVGIGSFLYYSLNRVNHVELDKSKESLGISTAPVITEKTEAEPTFNLYDDEIINIALFGLDRRDKEEDGRADATMILTVDFKNNKLKLSSLMRDMYIDIDGYEKTKFNHAYSYGGAQLAIKTINQNFGTDIQDYVTVDFFMLEKIIDGIGGIEVEIDEEEYPLMNEYMKEVATIEGEDFTPLTMAGLQTLDGKQAVSYARIRKVGNGDFERTDRQRIVLSEMIKQVSDMSKIELSKLVYKLLPYVETSLDTNTILDIGLNYLTKGIEDIEQDRFPRDGYWEGAMINKVWYMKFDLDSTKAQLQEFIYEPHQNNLNNDVETEVSSETKDDDVKPLSHKSSYLEKN